MTATTKPLADGTVVTAVVTLIPNTATIAYAWTPTTRALDASAHTMAMDSVMMVRADVACEVQSEKFEVPREILTCCD